MDIRITLDNKQAEKVKELFPMLKQYKNRDKKTFRVYINNVTKEELEKLKNLIKKG